jgi:hypothetical protein
VSTSLLLQYAVIALAVLASVAVVMKRQFPNATRRLRVACALPLLREGRSGWMQALGRWIAPEAKSLANACGGCDGCEPRD